MAEYRTIEDIKAKLLELRSDTDGVLWEALYTFSSIADRIHQSRILEDKRGSCGVEPYEYADILGKMESDLDEFLEDLKMEGIL